MSRCCRQNAADRKRSLQLIGVALVAMEKTAHRIYELKARPEEYHFGPWVERINQQLAAALDWLEVAVADADAAAWLHGEQNDADGYHYRDRLAFRGLRRTVRGTPRPASCSC